MPMRGAAVNFTRAPSFPYLHFPMYHLEHPLRGRLSAGGYVLSCDTRRPPPAIQAHRHQAQRRNNGGKESRGPRRLPGCAGERRGVASETNPDKHGSWTPPAARDCRQGECLVTAYCRNALPCAIPDCRDRATTPQRLRTSLTDYADVTVCSRESCRA